MVAMASDPDRRRGYPDLTEYIRQMVDEAPPLEDWQKARLGRILRAGARNARRWPQCTADNPPCPECRDGHA